MTELDDHDLLAEYARTGSEAAFAALVARHVNLVHSAARRFTGNPHHAEEITQAVFVILARKAAGLRRGTVLSGWLYQTARLTAANFVKGEIRRQNREQEAHMQSTLNEPEAAAWQQIAPMLDEAMGRLGEADRNAVVLRYFENKSAREVAATLKVNEAAAHKRVNRAVDRLRKFFSKRGVTLTATLLAGAVAANSVQAAPAGLAAAATVTAAQGATLSATLTTLVNTTMKTMTWLKLKFAAGAGVAALLAGGVVTVAISQTGGGDKLTAQEIVRRSLASYAALSNYHSTGKTIEEIDGKTLTASFSMRLGRPGFYLVEYEQHGPGLTNKGAAWCDGSGDYFANEVANQTNKLPFPGPAHNLGNLLGISGGVTAEIPAMFFGIEIPDAPAKGTWSELVQPVKWDPARLVKEPDEKSGETECLVLSFETDAGKIRLWVGKEDLLIHRSRQWVKSRLPEVTDGEITTLLAGLPQPVPLPMEEMKRRINEGRKNATATMKAVTVVFSDDKGSSGLKSMTIQPPSVTVFTQTHENIVTNQAFTAADFAR